MKTTKMLAGGLLAAGGLAAAAFLGTVSPADAGERALPVRMADAEQAITIQGDAIESLRQQVITIAGQDFGARIDKLDKGLADMKAELAAARQENAELRGLLGTEVERLHARIGSMQATIDARIDAEVAKLQAADAALESRLAKAIADGDVALAAQMDALDARITAVANAQNGTVNLPPS